MSFFTDDFNVENYIEKHPETHKIEERDPLDDYMDKIQDEGLAIIGSPETYEDMKQMYANYLNLPKDKKKRSDEISRLIYDIDVNARYGELRESFGDFDNDGDIPQKIIKEQVEDEHVIPNYTDYDRDDAKRYMDDTGYPIITPCANLSVLEKMWDNYNSYPHKIRRESDWKSIEIFGIDNEEHYKLLKAHYSSKEDIDPIEVESLVNESYLGDQILSHETFATNESVTTSDRAQDLLNLSITKTENYDRILTHNIIDKSVNEYIGTHQNVNYDVIPFEDLPFYTPDEIIDNLPDAEADPIGDAISAGIISENMSNWFNDYCNACSGMGYNYNSLEWKHSIEKLMLAKKKAEDDKTKDIIDKALTGLGWPDVDYTPRNAVIATKRVKSIMNQGSTEFVDLTGMKEENDYQEAAAVSEDNILYPVFITLHEGKSAFSAAIKGFTHSTFSHAAISFDPELKKMYSFGIEGSKKGAVGGFITENIETKPKDRHVAVYAVFLKKPDFDKLKDNIEDFIENVGKTTYSYINLLLGYIFRIPLNMKRSMVCSQFVDRMLKLIDVDISKKSSTYVAPGDFEKYAKENKKIYILYDGLVGKFKGSRIKSIIKRISSKAEPIKESFSVKYLDPIYTTLTMIDSCHSVGMLREFDEKLDKANLSPDAMKIYETMLKPCIYAEAYFNEAKDLPVKFDQDGNLFIKNIKKRDYEAEYAKSHKLLKKYEEAKNVNGIKYELCRLWAMNTVIEEKLHSDKFKSLPSTAIASSKEAKARAKILNDFNYYMSKALKYDPEFNFQEYYNESPFNDAVLKIDKNTVRWSAQLAKTIMTAL